MTFQLVSVGCPECHHDAPADRSIRHADGCSMSSMGVRDPLLGAFAAMARDPVVKAHIDAARARQGVEEIDYSNVPIPDHVPNLPPCGNALHAFACTCHRASIDEVLEDAQAHADFEYLRAELTLLRARARAGGFLKEQRHG